MKLNESTAVSTNKVLLVPYDRRHVLTYHAWMEDPAIQQATASERLTLAEEYDNQLSWRASHDKLTFIVCQPSAPSTVVAAGEVDAPNKMVGDVNLFLTPYDDDNENSNDDSADRVSYVEGEVDIMIADAKHRGQGMGRAAVGAFLGYVAQGGDTARHKQVVPKLRMLVAKINAGNGKSIALFKSLGFEQEGDVNYFGEVKLVLRDDDNGNSLREKISVVGAPEGYAEVVYTRSEGDTASL
ncbi:GNAT domain-containing protein [Cercophora scortea]|uniref:GNAT domain-containing protein n=1 Tax=Cercophora scortea TaxID=314031 RepID=A0AAE0INQ1_9PEZI|nr:GNAT domain-containing protein [Cercophora scortea]